MIFTDHITFKEIQSDELDLLQRMAEVTFRDTYAHLNDPKHFEEYIVEKLNTQQLATELSNHESLFLFGLHAGEKVGYLKLNFGAAQTETTLPNALEIERIYILQSFQGKGFGRLFLDQAKAVARENDLQHLWLGVWEENPKAIRFYEKNGFKKFGEHIFKVGPEEQIDYMMMLSL